MKIITFFILAIVGGFAQAQILTSPGIKYGGNTAVGKYAPIRDFKMYYETYGTGQPMLLIHGNSGSIADMSNQIEYFSKKYQVIVADSR